MKYNLRLDALRGVAILLVIIGHWLMLGKTMFSHLGVELFFVISGFLISTILIGVLNSIEKKETTTGKSIKNFFIRRFLRIFPLYYAVIFLCYIFLYPNDSIKDHFLFDLFYINNIYQWFYNIQPRNFLHLWSLSIEEQFYLIWPFLILLSTRGKLIWSILLTIFIGITFRMFYFLDVANVYSQHPMGSILLPACLDMFGYGALLAYLYSYNHLSPNMNFNKAALIFLVGLSIYVFCLFNPQAYTTKVIFRIGSGLMSVAAIIYCYSNRETFLDILFKNKALVYIGKISYGMYLFHLLIPGEKIRQLSEYLTGITPRFSIELCIKFLLLITISSLSWFLFEKPINNLKDKIASYK